MAKDYSKIIKEEYGTSPLCPMLDVPEGAKTEKWYRQCIRYYSTFYNVYRASYGQEGTQRFKSPATRIWENFQYIQGTQNSTDYSFFTPDFQGITQDELGIVPGKKIASLVDFMRGQCGKMLDNLKLEAKSINPDGKTKEMEMVDKLLFQMEMGEALSQLETEDGLSFTPAGSFTPEIREDVGRWLEKTFKERQQSTADVIAKGIMYENNFRQIGLKTFTHAVTAGVCGVDVETYNGDVCLTPIPSQYSIVDTSIDDDFNYKARFAGYNYFLTIPEIFSRFNLTDEEKEIIKGLATKNSYPMTGWAMTQPLLNSTNTNFNWWQAYSGQPVVACTKMYWKAMQDLNYRKKQDQFGALKMKPTDYYGGKTNEHGEIIQKTSDYRTEGWEQGTLIGNVILKNFGPAPKYGLYEKNIKSSCPIRYFLPNMNFGVTVSVVDKLRYHQDMIDALRRKIVDLAAKDLGNVGAFNSASTGNVMVEKIIADLKITGLTLISPSGEPYDDDKLRNLFMSMKMGGSDYIKDYMMYIDQEKREMEEIVNIPRITLGQQTTTTGLGVQQNTIAQSTLGLYTLYTGFVQWWSETIQYATNVGKWVYTINGDFESRVKVGDAQWLNLKLTRDVRLEEFGIYFKVQDMIDEQSKQALMDIALADAQNGNLDTLDVISVQNAQTYTDLKNDLEYSLRKKEQKREKQQAIQNMLQQAQFQENLQVQKEIAAGQQAVSEANQQSKNQTQLLDTAIKAESVDN